MLLTLVPSVRGASSSFKPTNPNSKSTFGATNHDQKYESASPGASLPCCNGGQDHWIAIGLGYQPVCTLWCRPSGVQREAPTEELAQVRLWRW